MRLVILTFVYRITVQILCQYSADVSNLIIFFQLSGIRQ